MTVAARPIWLANQGWSVTGIDFFGFVGTIAGGETDSFDVLVDDSILPFGEYTINVIVESSGGSEIVKVKGTKGLIVDIIDALDGPIALTECADETGDDCSYEAVCRVKTNWQRINQVVKEALSQVTLEEMSERTPGVMLGGAQELITLGR